MSTKILAALSVLIAIWAIFASFTSSNALVLREENQTNYSSRSGTNLSGRYNRDGVWIYVNNRSTYEGFQGGGPGGGK